MFESYKVDLDKPVVMTCGGAVVAPLVGVAGFIATGKMWPVYDVSLLVVMLRLVHNRTQSPTQLMHG